MLNIELKQFELRSFISFQTLPLVQLYHYNIQLYNCTFKRNTNMKALIYIRPSNAQIATGCIRIKNSTFSDNKNMTFIKVELEYQAINSKMIYISLQFVNVSSNEYHHIESLIFVVNGLLHFQSVFSIKIITMMVSYTRNPHFYTCLGIMT